MPAMKASVGSCGVLGVLVVWTAPLVSSKATTSVNVPPVSNASRYRAIGALAYSDQPRSVNFECDLDLEVPERGLQRNDQALIRERGQPRTCADDQCWRCHIGPVTRFGEQRCGTADNHI